LILQKLSSDLYRVVLILAIKCGVAEKAVRFDDLSSIRSDVSEVL